MQTNYVCRFCGRRGTSFAGSSCPKSPTRHHELVAEQSSYACRYCGRTSASPSFAGMSCNKSPTRKCVLVG